MKLLSAFKDRLSICRECEKKRNAGYRAKAAERIKEWSRKYYHAHKDERKKAFAEWYQKHGKEYARRKAKKHRKRLAKLAREYYARNREKCIQRALRYQKTPNGKIAKRKAEAKRRFAKSGVGDSELKEIANWMKSWINKKSVTCYWCGRKVRPKECHMDHVIPIAKGGLHQLDNLVIACRMCNHKKQSLMPEEFNSRTERPRLFW